VLLRPLPYAHPDRLISIGRGDEPVFSATSWLSYRDIRTQSRLLADVAGYSSDVSVLATRDTSESIAAPHITANLFTMLGARPSLGRTFTDAEGQSGGPLAVMLSNGLWRQNFHADPGIVGQAVNIGGRPYTVVGVMPQGFRFPEELDLQKGVWLALQPTQAMLKDPGYNFLNVIGELRPGISIAQAQQELNAITEHIPLEKSDSPVSFRATSYQEVLTGPVRPVLYALFGALVLVLLIACANVSNLLIGRCLGRQQEFAVRRALGANRMRLVRQMLTEGFALSLPGCAFGLLLAKVAMLAIRKLPDGTIPRADSIAIHWSVLLALAVVAIITTLLSSILPALLVVRTHPQAALQVASRGTGSRSVGRKLSGVLVAVEVALSTLLLVGTGMLFHTLWNLERSQLGFETAHITTFSAMPADAAGFSAMAVSEDTAHAPVSVATLIYHPILEQMRRLPGIESAALATTPPLSGDVLTSDFDIVGQPSEPRKNKPVARVSAVSGDYARTLGTPSVRGRMVSDDDVANAPFVAVINETLARKYFANENPLGMQIILGGKDTGMIKPYTIVGVLGDQADSMGDEVQPFIMLPQEQVPTTSLFYQALLKTVVTFVVRTREGIPVAAEMHSLFHQAAPGFALDDFQTMRQAVERHTFSQRLGLYLVSSFAGLAVAMVVAGLYGVLSQLVSYRRREIAVRMALGATRRSVAQIVVRQGSILIGVGLGVGLLLTFPAERLIQSFLYRVHPLDAWTYAGVLLALPTIGLIAALVPAHKAASIQPMQALREE